MFKELFPLAAQGAFSLLLSADLYTEVSETSDHGYPIVDHLARMLDGGEDRVEELEVRRADGEITWVAVRVASVHDDDGGGRTRAPGADRLCRPR